MFRKLAVALAILTLSSCATLFAEDTRSVMITSNPPGAHIIVNGVDKGQTPTRLNVGNHERLEVSIQKDGFHGGGCYINTSIGAGWVILDLVLFATVLPLVIDLVTNEWASLNSAYCTANLLPMNR